MLRALVQGTGEGVHDRRERSLEDVSKLFPVAGALLQRASTAQDAGDVAGMMDALETLHDALSLFLLRH